MRNVIKHVLIINDFHRFKYLKGSEETTFYVFIMYFDYSIIQSVSPTGTYGVFSMVWLTRGQVTLFVAE